MIKNYLITGDTHGIVIARLNSINTEIYSPEETALIILGDMGLNYYLSKKETKYKKAVNDTGFHIYAVRGNHEERPENLGMDLYWDDEVKGKVYYEPEFPNIRYFMDGGEYEINGHSVLVIGGAYSVDKWYRLARAGYTEKDEAIENPKVCGWFKDEQLSTKEMSLIEEKCRGKKYDFVFTHTCPLAWEPTDLFLDCVDQSKVDKSMEIWLNSLKDEIKWTIWLFGHYHDDRKINFGVEMLFYEIQNMNTIWEYWT